MGSLICGTAIPWRRYVSVPRGVGAVNLWNFKKQNTYHNLGNSKGGRGNLDELDYGVWIDTQAHHKYY